MARCKSPGRSCSNLIDEKVHDTLLVKWTIESWLILLVHLSYDSRICNKFDVASFEARLHHIVANHRHVFTSFRPESVHDFEEL